MTTTPQPLSILAGATLDLRFDGVAFVPAEDEATQGPTFTIRAIDYFTAMEAQAHDGHVATARAAIAAGLVAIDGDKAKAKAFIKAPAAGLGTPIFNAIWGQTWGNSPAPVESE
jgi:hypothetical protein